MESGTIRFNKVALGQIIKSLNIMLFAANVEYFKETIKSRDKIALQSTRKHKS